MPRYIVKLNNRYCEWSTVVDAPVTPLLTESQLSLYWRLQYGLRGDDIQEMVATCDEHDYTGWRSGITLDELVKYNRADKQGPLSKEKLIELFTCNDEEIDEWLEEMTNDLLGIKNKE
jgi:hypothetical protein